MAGRFAVALILIGVIMLSVFLLTLQVQQADLRVLLAGAAVSGLGMLLRRRAARHRARHSGRFTTLRRLRGLEDEEVD